jgi:hypothetical protein
MSGVSTPVQDVRIVTADARFAMSVAVSLRSTPYSVTFVDAGSSGLADAVGHGTPPVAAVVELTGTETVVELRDMLQRWPATRCLFVVRNMPLSATLARIAKQHGGVILAKDEPPIVITATLIAMMLGTSTHEA